MIQNLLENLQNLIFLIPGFLKDWWWIIVLPILFIWTKKLYLCFIRKKWSSKIKWVLLKIKIPREIFKPHKAMEEIFNAFGAMHNLLDWKKKWLEGKTLSPLSLEIATINGQSNFFIRTPEIYKDFVETSIYSQYPEVEIFPTEDYVTNIPNDVPNDNWDLWGRDCELVKEDAYPIKTYPLFFQKDVGFKTEKEIDPLSLFLEGMTVFGPHEQFWMQIIIIPTTDEESGWVKKGNALIDKLMKRAKPKFNIFNALLEFINVIIFPPDKQGKGNISKENSSMIGKEREDIEYIQEKINKQGFKTSIRVIYLGKRDVFLKAKTRIVAGFLNQLSSERLNKFTFVKKTKTKAGYFFRERRSYLKKRAMFKNYIKRKQGKVFILNAEELATLYHFSSKAAVSTISISRIESKKGQPPINLPVE